jgi:hypothetical protein
MKNETAVVECLPHDEMQPALPMIKNLDPRHHKHTACPVVTEAASPE